MKRYNFFLPEQVVDALRKEAERTGLTMSELIRRILTDGLKKYEQQ
jgi:plasmid stability protein